MLFELGTHYTSIRVTALISVVVFSIFLYTVIFDTFPCHKLCVRHILSYFHSSQESFWYIVIDVYNTIEFKYFDGALKQNSQWSSVIILQWQPWGLCWIIDDGASWTKAAILHLNTDHRLRNCGALEVNSRWASRSLSSFGAATVTMNWLLWCCLFIGALAAQFTQILFVTNLFTCVIYKYILSGICPFLHIWDKNFLLLHAV